MPPVLISLACLAAQLDDISGPSYQASPLPNLRPVAEMVAATDAGLQSDGRAKTNAERAATAYELTLLYRDIQRDPRLAVSEPLQRAKSKLWTRLTRIKKDVRASMRRKGQTDETLTDAEVLALADSEVVSQSMADHLALSGPALGGPAAILRQGGSIGSGGGAAGPPDYGPELVDLIQRTIVPDFWDVNGGPGTVVYFRPLMCLVVRATSEVHHRLGGVVVGLRDAR